MKLATKLGIAGLVVAVPLSAWAVGPGHGDGPMDGSGPHWSENGRGHHGGHGGRGDGLGFGFIRMLQGMDADMNGLISGEEWAAGGTDRISGADADGDGSVTLKEMEDFALARVQERIEERVARRFERMDTDGDGAISAEEMAAQTEERFAHMDRDGDGQLTIHDVPSEGRGDRGGRGGPGGPGPDGPADEAPAE